MIWFYLLVVIAIITLLAYFNPFNLLKQIRMNKRRRERIKNDLTNLEPCYRHKPDPSKNRWRSSKDEEYENEPEYFQFHPDCKECLRANNLEEMPLYRRVKKNTKDTWLALLCIFSVFYFLVAAITEAVNYHSQSNIKNSMYVLEELTVQRDELLDILQDSLAEEDFIQLMNAAVPDDVLFLRQSPGVSEFLLGRADRLVAVNSSLYKERNGLLSQSRGLCNTVQNPLIPALPFTDQKCDMGRVLGLTEDLAGINPNTSVEETD